MEYLIHLIQGVGLWGYLVLFIIIFFESFPLTFFLPGDSLLFVTGFLASQGHFSPFVLLPTLFIASFIGYLFSYAMGQKIRDFILRSNDRYWFKKKHLDYTESFFNKYGTKTIIIGRFVPIVRSFAPTLAGAVQMQYRRFILFTAIGGLVWTAGVTTLGFYLGKLIPNAHIYLTPIILGIIIVSLLPTFFEYLSHRKNKSGEAPRS